MVSIKDEGDKIAGNASATDVAIASLHVFVKGAHNLGPVIESRETSSANIGPGLGVIHAVGAAGEDTYTEHGIDTALGYAIMELDENQIADCNATYAAYDLAPGIPYHMNPGAYVRNVNYADPNANIEPDTAYCAAATGTYMVATEATLVNTTTGTTEDWTAATTTGTNGTGGCTIFSRILLRNAYYFADPGTAATRVAYIAQGD